MLEDLLKGDMGDIVSDISSKVGASEEQAGGFVAKAMSMIEDLIGGDDLDLQTLMQSLMKGDVSALTSKLDLGALGATLGGGEDKAKQGLETLMGSLQDKVGGEGMLDQLTGGKGIGDVLGGLGGMFGKG